MPKKCIMILLDGLGDRSYPEFEHKTPLQSAKTPVLDRLAAQGANGLYHAGLLGQALPSENAHFAMFGYDRQDFPGRGALEALGAGLAIENGQVALLAHFVSVTPAADGTLVLKEGKPESTAAEIRALIRTVGQYKANDIQLRLHHTSGFHGILSLSGRVSPYVTDSDPMEEGRSLVAVVPWADHADDPPTQNTARALSSYLAWVHLTLKDHAVNHTRRKAGQLPLNGLVFQRAGRLKPVAPFRQKYGLKGLIMASGIVYHGLAAYLGMDVYKVKDTAQPADDLARRLQIAIKQLKVHDFIHVHTKTPDQAAHTKDPMAKKRVIEELDQGIGAVIDTLLADPELLLVVAADHSTPSTGPLVHSGEPVPLIFHGPGIRRDTVRKFDEISAAAGAMGFVRGKELIYLILNHLDRAKLCGLMDTPIDQPYYPGNYEPFRLQME
jgi:2,3-bisphosphoglycerate-independent phosphoglycerate mutase